MSLPKLHSSNKIIRYKNLKNKEGETHQDAEILISSDIEEEGGSMDNGKRFPFLKSFNNEFSNFIIIFLFFLAMAYLYYFCTNTLQITLSEESHNSSSNISCVPLQNVSKLIILHENMADYNTCSDNTSCHLLLDTIEHEHDGLKYNFVIGPGGELYIGSGFNCLVNRSESVVYIKLLKSLDKEWSQQYLEELSRLSEIIRHGVLCEKISQDYNVLIKVKHNSGVVTKEYNTEKPCSSLDCSKTRPYHVHDPSPKMRMLLQSEFGWTFCGNFSNSTSIREGRVIRMEKLPKHSCSPLHTVDKITVDVVTTPTFSCSNDSSCLRTYEESHDGFKYNFIIGHNNEVYVGLGFKCKTENTSENILKIKVLRKPDQIHRKPIEDEHIKFLQIIDEGIACGKILEIFSVKANCNIKDHIVECRQSYEQFNIRWILGIWLSEINDLLSDSKDNHYLITFEHGKGIVPSTFRYQFCTRKHKHKPSTILYNEPTSQTNTTDNVSFYFNNNTSCVPLKTVKKVVLITEKTDLSWNNSCSNNVTCSSLIETIEREHDGLMYNFVIGPGGELYIGAGFKCLLNSDKSALYIKILKSKELYSKEKYSAVCLRLSEIIEHGILCEKISQNYTTLIQFNSEYNIRVTEEPPEKLCPTLETGMNRTYHVHDPDYDMRTLIPSDSKWTFCGNFSSRTNMTKDKVITMDSVPEQSCLPLKVIDEITVDVVETPEFNCSDDSSCLRAIEKNHEGFKYNFIIRHNGDVFVGSGFKCRAENSSDNVLKFKVLASPYEKYTGLPSDPGNLKFIQIIDEGITCEKISDTFRIEAFCNIANQHQTDDCRQAYEYFSNSYVLQLESELFSKGFEQKYIISSEHGRGLVPNTFRYQFCSRDQSHETVTIDTEPTSMGLYAPGHNYLFDLSHYD